MTAADYTLHDGKSMPLAGDTLVKVKFRDGRGPALATKADWWDGTGSAHSCWIHDGSNSDIIAYRVIE